MYILWKVQQIVHKRWATCIKDKNIRWLMRKFSMNLHSIDETSSYFKMVMMISGFKVLKAEIKSITKYFSCRDVQ